MAEIHVTNDRLAEIERTYRELGLDPASPGIRGADGGIAAVPGPVVITPLLSNNSSFDD